MQGRRGQVDAPVLRAMDCKVVGTPQFDVYVQIDALSCAALEKGTAEADRRYHEGQVVIEK
ncbi:hypothetical protein PISMIDRAFT_674493 [Pisolithus microcarpus 441]|uniref:Uncharacterized protein n=1 Tax=Pisolithus microcarpus 441 TaxID=765257 RepID=A0A0C9ZE77_9AGAM|nr:hypothetical protein PISMIDRAFT_674493 [Pisolithus microcarpus 441]